MNELDFSNVVEIIRYGQVTSLVINGVEMAWKVTDFELVQGPTKDEHSPIEARYLTLRLPLDGLDDSFTYREAAEGELPPWERDDATPDAEE